MNLRSTRTVTLISLSSLQPRLRNEDVRNVDLFVILKNNTRIMQRPRRKCVNSGANGFAVERNTATPRPNRARACVHVYYCGLLDSCQSNLARRTRYSCARGADAHVCAKLRRHGLREGLA